MDSSSTPTTDSVPPRTIRLLRELRHAFRAANECLERTGNTDRELAMMDAFVRLQGEMRTALAALFEKKDPTPILASIKIALLERGAQSEIDELKAFAEEANIGDFLEKILAFDVAAHLAAGGTREGNFDEGVQLGADLRRHADTDPGDEDGVVAGDSADDYHRQRLASGMRSAMLEVLQTHVDDATADRLMQRALDIAELDVGFNDDDGLPVTVTPDDLPEESGRRLAKNMHAALNQHGISVTDETAIAIGTAFWSSIRQDIEHDREADQVATPN